MKLVVLLTLLSGFFFVGGEEYEFPDDFVWGGATGTIEQKQLISLKLIYLLWSASYQIEGAWNVDGKIPSVWDTASHKNPSIIVDGSTGDDAGMSYYYYEKDIQALVSVGVK
jgi:beta-glucosidase/6-phospho-beta-glucosidase/beta-galactosidase